MNDRQEGSPGSAETSNSFSLSCEEIPIALIRLDQDLVIQQTNRAAQRLLGMERPGRTLLGFFEADERERVRAFLTQKPPPAAGTSIRAHLMTGGLARPLLVLAGEPGEDGLLTVALLDLTMVSDENEMPVGRESIYHILAEGSDVGVVIANKEFRVVYANHRFSEIIGVPREDIVGVDFRHYIHPDDRGIVANRYRLRLERADVTPVYEFRVQRADGSYSTLRVHSTSLIGRDGEPYSVAHLIDISSEVESRRRLEESERKYRTLIETMLSGIFVEDAQNTITLVNTSLCEMLEYDSPDDLVGQPASDIIAGWSSPQMFDLRRRHTAGMSELYEAKLITRLGRRIPVLLSVSPLYDLEGGYTGTLTVVTDISQLIEARMEAQFLLDLLMHDVGNQLQLVLMGADMLESRPSPDDTDVARAYIRDGVNRCLEIISKVRRTEAVGSASQGPVNLSAVLKMECDLVQKQLGVMPTIEEMPERVMVLADNALGQMLRNILENAVKHNPADDKRVWISGRRLNSMFLLCVTDNGPGLSDSKKRDLFDPHRRYGGVGLHLVWRIVKRYGGDIIVSDRVEGEPEKGLRVCVRLPLTDEA